MRFRDPVCGMTIQWEEATDYVTVGPFVVYFCCPGCAARFRKDPRRHVVATSAAGLDNDESDATEPCAGVSLEPDRVGVTRGSAHVKLHVTVVPRVGTVTLDRLESLIMSEWQRRLGSEALRHRECRVVERGLLTYALEGHTLARGHQIDVLLAAEVARLRARTLDREHITAELRELPGAIREALSRAGVERSEAATFLSRIEEKLGEVREWIGKSTVGATAPAGVLGIQAQPAAGLTGSHPGSSKGRGRGQ